MTATAAHSAATAITPATAPGDYSAGAVGETGLRVRVGGAAWAVVADGAAADSEGAAGSEAVAGSGDRTVALTEESCEKRTEDCNVSG